MPVQFTVASLTGDSGVHFKWLNPLTGANEAVPAQYLSFAMDTPMAPGLSAGTLSTSPQRMVTFDVTDNSPAELSYELLRDGVVVATAEMNAATIADSQPITGSHTYTLRALNYAGTSPASAPQIVVVPDDFYADATTGASAYYFNSFSWNGGHVGGPELSGGPNIVAAGVPDYQETVPQIDFDYGATGNSPNPAICTDGFSTVHTGKLALPEDANGNGTPNETIDVQFVGNTDDHGIYFVNGQVAAQDLRPRAQGDYTNAGPLTLKEGQQYDFVIFQAEQFGGAGVHFKWNNPNGGALEPISGDLLTPRTGAPAAPTGVSGNGQGNFVALNWTDNATSEVAYLIERGDAAAGPFTPIGFSAVNAASFADTTVKPDTNYFYRVTAVNYEGKGAAAVLPVSSGTLTAPNATPITAGVARRAVTSRFAHAASPVCAQKSSSRSVCARRRGTFLRWKKSHMMRFATAQSSPYTQ